MQDSCWGVSDCCEKPTNISLADYLNLIMAVPKLDGAVMGLTDGNALKGAYQVLRNLPFKGGQKSQNRSQVI